MMVVAGKTSLNMHLIMKEGPHTHFEDISIIVRSDPKVF